MAALLQQAARRIVGSVLQRTQAAVTSPPAFDEERRRFLPRRMHYSTEKRALTPREDYLEKRFGHLKPHQIGWMLFKLVPFGKIFGLVLMAHLTVAVVSASREVRQERRGCREEARAVCINKTEAAGG